MMSLVRGVMAARKRWKGNSSDASACTRVRREVIMRALTSNMKKVGVEMSASSVSSRNAAQTRWMASSTPLVSSTWSACRPKWAAAMRSTASRSGYFVRPSEVIWRRRSSTLGEGESVFSLKSRRRASRPASGG